MALSYDDWLAQVCICLGFPVSHKETLKVNSWWTEQYFQGKTAETAGKEYCKERELP